MIRRVPGRTEFKACRIALQVFGTCWRWLGADVMRSIASRTGVHYHKSEFELITEAPLLVALVLLKSSQP